MKSRSKARSPSYGGVEPLEPRYAFAVTAFGTLLDVTAAAADTSQSISLAGKFDDTAVAGTVVQFNVNTTAPNDRVFVELFDQAGPGRPRTTPVTTANFLKYVDNGDYANTFIHRSVPGFIVQGGGFIVTGTTSFNVSSATSYGTIVNEPGTVGSTNVRGTIAMAKLGNDPNSASNQWFFNLANNTANLDNQNGGFTTFGRVLGDGMTVIDSTAAVPRFRYDPPYGQLPLRNVPNPVLAGDPEDPTVNLPVDGASLTASQFVAFPSITRAGELVYTVTSSNTGLVTGSIAQVGGVPTLVLTRAPGQSGSASITVKAASVFDATDFKELSFTSTWQSLAAPGDPSSVSGTAGAGQVSLSWTAPASTGGSAITDYIIEYSSNNGVSWTPFADGTSTATTATVTGLANGTSYVFRVAAKNSVGTGLFSANSAAVTPRTMPGAPTGVTGAAGNTEVSLSWTAPVSTGGSAITDYIIEYSSNNGLSWTLFADGTSTTTTATLTGLANGTSYVFRVAAKNSAGTGLFSANSAAVTPRTLAGPPTGVSGTAGTGQVSLSWTAPASTGGSAITDYIIEYSSNNGVTWTPFADGTSTATTATVTGLANGTSYVFRVAAKNSVGTGLFSANSAAVTPRTTPDAPTGVSGTAGTGQVSLSWTAPASTGGSAITDYIIEYSSNNGVSWTPFADGTSTATMATVTGLANGTGYVFRVAAKNSLGTGLLSAASAAVTPSTLAGLPTSVAGTPASRQVSLSWTAPASNGNSAITDYIIEYSSNNGVSWTPFADGTSTATTATVTGLTNGAAYVFRVAAVTGEGTGAFSPASSVVTPRSVFVVGAEIGARSTPVLKLVNAASGAVLAETLAFEGGFRGGVRVAMGDVDGDGIPEVVAASGPGRVGEIRVYRQQVTAGVTTLQELTAYRTQPFGPRYSGGVEVAVGDVDADGREDLVAAMSRGAGTVAMYRSVNAVDPIENTAYRTFTPFGSTFDGGASVAVADVGTFVRGAIVSATAPDGRVEIVVGSGAGMQSIVRIYDISAAPRIVNTIRPFSGTSRGGVAVAVGRYDPDTIDDIVVSSGRGGRSATRVFSGRVDQSSTVLASSAAFASLARPNAPVFTAPIDLDGDGKVDRFHATQRDANGIGGVQNVALNGTRTGPLGSLKGPLRIAAPRRG
jgi:cyclophilin family peptidyl-prolyl cis-trans isomerase